MIDSRIPLMTQAIDMNAMLENGSKQTELFTKMRTDGELARIYREAGGDLGKMAELGKQSKYAQLVMPNIQSQVVAQQKAYWDQQKTQSEIDKTQSEAFKNNAQGGGYTLDNSGKKIGAIQGAFQQASLTGDKAQVLLGLNALVRTGMMSPEDYQSQAAIVGTMTPNELKQYAGGINFANAKDPAALQYQSADNAANNAQSDINNQRTTNASIYSTNVGAETANKNRDQQQQQFDAELYVKQNKPLDYFTAQDGTRYAVYANGQGIPISNGQGGVLKEKPKNAETPTQKMERQEKTIDFSVAAQGAAEGSKLAATLANDLGGLNSASGASPINWAARKIPGTEAFNYVQKLETLKANVFLSQVSKMKGMGALTEAEGARLEKAIASLDANQDSGQLQKNLTEIAKQLSVIAKTNGNKTKIYAGTSGQAKPQAQQGFDVKSFFNE